MIVKAHRQTWRWRLLAHYLGFSSKWEGNTFLTYFSNWKAEKQWLYNYAQPLGPHFPCGILKSWNVTHTKQSLSIDVRVLLLPALLFVCCACWFHPGFSTSKRKNPRQRDTCDWPQHACWEDTYRHVWSAVQIDCQHRTCKTVRRLKKHKKTELGSQWAKLDQTVCFWFTSASRLGSVLRESHWSFRRSSPYGTSSSSNHCDSF